MIAQRRPTVLRIDDLEIGMACTPEPFELTEEMVNAGVDAYRQMALHDERCWYEPRAIVVGIIEAVFLARSSSQPVHFQGQLTNWLHPKA